MTLTRRLQDYTLVTAITVLVWLYAEGRTVESYAPEEAIPVTISLTSPQLVVVSQSRPSVKLECKGARGEIMKLRRVLPSGLTIPLDATEPGEKNISLEQMIPRAESMQDIRVSLARVDPPALTVVVDKLVTKSVPVTFTPAEVQLVTGSLKISPEAVSLTAPQGKLASLGVDLDKLTLEAEPATPLRTLAPGVQQTITGRVKLPAKLGDDPQVKLSPDRVEMTLTIDKKEDTVKLPSVPVWVTLPPEDTDKYTVKLSDDNRVLKDVVVTGPSDMVQKVRDGLIPVIATVRLSSDDLAKGVGTETTGAVRFDIPAPLAIQTTVTSVRFTIGRREAGRITPP
ncbi:MAG: hypothetical protein GC162_15345 [Planctomycetes bacterium]|nr:hypothetical protein [Planctomycetota bacterium]